MPKKDIDMAVTFLDNFGTNEQKSYIILEHHPNDSRIKLDNSGTIQTLTSRMGTGGGNVPMVIEVRNARNYRACSGINSAECRND